MHLDHDKETGIISYTILDGGRKDVYKGGMDLRSFYMDLNNIFHDNPYVTFSDRLGTQDETKVGHFFEYEVKEGEQVDNGANENRASGLYEKKFTWKKKQGFIEFEMEWEARAPAPHSKYGWFEISINIVNRMMKDKEILVGNQKKVVQDGMWELRNAIKYKNNVVPEYLKKIPFIKNSHNLQHLYLEFFYEHTLEDDIIKFGEKKILTLLKETMQKHFVTNY